MRVENQFPNKAAIPLDMGNGYKDLENVYKAILFTSFICKKNKQDGLWILFILTAYLKFIG